MGLQYASLPGAGGAFGTKAVESTAQRARSFLPCSRCSATLLDIQPFTGKVPQANKKPRTSCAGNCRRDCHPICPVHVAALLFSCATGWLLRGIHAWLLLGNIYIFAYCGLVVRNPTTEMLKFIFCFSSLPTLTKHGGPSNLNSGNSAGPCKVDSSPSCDSRSGGASPNLF